MGMAFIQPSFSDQSGNLFGICCLVYIWSMERLSHMSVNCYDEGHVTGYVCIISTFVRYDIPSLFLTNSYLCMRVRACSYLFALPLAINVVYVLKEISRHSCLISDFRCEMMRRGQQGYQSSQ